MRWSQIPEFDSASSYHNIPFAGARTQQTWKLSMKVPVDEWLCRNFEKFKVIVQEG